MKNSANLVGATKFRPAEMRHVPEYLHAFAVNVRWKHGTQEDRGKTRVGEADRIMKMQGEKNNRRGKEKITQPRGAKQEMWQKGQTRAA